MTRQTSFGWSRGTIWKYSQGHWKHGPVLHWKGIFFFPYILFSNSVEQTSLHDSVLCLPCSPIASFWQFHLRTKILRRRTQLKFPVKLIHRVIILQTIHLPPKIPDVLCCHLVSYTRCNLYRGENIWCLDKDWSYGQGDRCSGSKLTYQITKAVV